MYFTVVDETCSCRLLIMLGDGPRCKVLGDNSFSAYLSDATTGNILDSIIIIMKRKENLLAVARQKHTLTQTGST